MKKVAIIGGGFGGFTAAQMLSDKFEVTLFGNSDHFLFTPLLLSVLSGRLTKKDVAFEIRDSLPNVKFVKWTVKEVDTSSRILFADKEYDYDYLLISIGATTNFFGIDGADEHCMTMKTIDDALSARRLLKMNPKDSYVVIGAGATGVELAAEIKELIPLSKVYLVEGKDRILPPVLDAKIRDLARRKLEAMGIGFSLNSRVTKVRVDSVTINESKVIDAKAVFWTAGVKPNKIDLDEKAVDGSGHFIVNRHLLVNGYENIFAIGDCAAFEDKKGKFLPDFAQVAVKQGKLAALNIERHSKGLKLKNFLYASDGFILSLGGSDGIAEVKGIVFSGKLASMMHRLVYSSKVPGLGNKIRTFFKHQ